LWSQRNGHCNVTAAYIGDNTTAVVREQLYGYILSPATREHEIMEETFSVRSTPGLYNEDQLSLGDSSKEARVEAGSNISTVALRVVGDDENEPSAWKYNWATLFLGDKITGTRPSRLGDSRI
jgi:hypothetical protein